MNELEFTYEDLNWEPNEKKYATIIDFLEDLEYYSGSDLEGATNIDATFDYPNADSSMTFDTLDDLVDYCRTLINN